MKLRVLSVLVCCLVVLSACAGGRAGSAGGPWQLLGERTVHGKFDKDVIEVGAREGTFQRIEVRVKGSALEMYDIKVVFGDGTDFHPETRLVFGRGAGSRVIDLPGNQRIVRRVEFRYGNLPRGGRARVRLFGGH